MNIFTSILLLTCVSRLHCMKCSFQCLGKGKGHSSSPPSPSSPVSKTPATGAAVGNVFPDIAINTVEMKMQDGRFYVASFGECSSTPRWLLPNNPSNRFSVFMKLENNLKYASGYFIHKQVLRPGEALQPGGMMAHMRVEGEGPRGKFFKAQDFKEHPVNAHDHDHQTIAPDYQPQNNYVYVNVPRKDAPSIIYKAAVQQLDKPHILVWTENVAESRYSRPVK